MRPLPASPAPAGGASRGDVDRNRPRCVCAAPAPPAPRSARRRRRSTHPHPGHGRFAVGHVSLSRVRELFCSRVAGVAPSVAPPVSSTADISTSPFNLALARGHRDEEPRSSTRRRHVQWIDRRSPSFGRDVARWGAPQQRFSRAVLPRPVQAPADDTGSPENCADQTPWPRKLAKPRRGCCQCRYQP